MRELRLYLVVGIILAALGLTACPAEVTSDEDDGGGGRPPATLGESACGTCLRSACGGQLDTCGADPGCAGWLDCALDCPVRGDGTPDAACEAGCPPPAPGIGENARGAVEACRTTGPGAECAECGAEPLGHPILDQVCAPSAAADACDKCEAERCCETRCDPACQSYVACMQGCSDMPCRDGCAAAHPDGVQSFGNWIGCSMPHCRQHCGHLIIGACLECGILHCPEQWADCLSTPDCYLRFLCGSFCNGAPDQCFYDCDSRYPAGAPYWGAFLLCVGDQCVGTACSGGPEI